MTKLQRIHKIYRQLLQNRLLNTKTHEELINCATLINLYFTNQYISTYRTIVFTNLVRLGLNENEALAILNSTLGD